MGEDDLRRIGDDAFDRGDYEKAIECYEKFIDRHPNDLVILSRLATACVNTANYEQAKMYYLRYLQNDLNNAAIWLNLGLTLTKLGEHESVIDAFAKCLKIDPGNASAWERLGNLFESRNQLPEALFCYKNLPASEPFKEMGNRVRELESRGITPKEPMIDNKFLDSSSSFPNSQPWVNQNARQIIFTSTALLHMLEFCSQGASSQLPQDQWRMSSGFFLCRVWRDTYRVEDAFGSAHGPLTGISLTQESYAQLAMIDGQRPGMFVGAWFHTRPGRGTCLSDIDAKTLQFHQYPNPKAFTLVFDHTTMGPTSLGFSLHRLSNPAELSTYEIFDYTLERLTPETLIHCLTLFYDSPAFANPLWEALKPRISKELPPPIPTAILPHRFPRVERKDQRTPIMRAEDLTTDDRAYYVKTWGFDPVKDQIFAYADSELPYWYETLLKCENDLALDTAGVVLVVRVEMGDDGQAHNRLGFERQHIRAMVECIHTAIYDGTPEEISDYSQEDYEALISSTEGRPAILPPWEHFASLKSFAAGLVDRGILTTLFGVQSRSFSEEDYGEEFWGARGLGMEVLTNQLRKALGSVAQDVIAPLTTERAIEVIEKAPEQWITSHAEVLYKQYNVDSLFGNQAYLTSVDNTTKRKLLGLFLALLETDLHESWNKNAKTFLTEISKGDFLDTLDENLLQDLIHTLSDHWDQWFPTKDPDDMFLRRLWRRSRRKTR